MTMNMPQRYAPLSPADFTTLGVNDVAYIKACIRDEQSVYAIHAANGAEVAVAASRELAQAIVRQHGLEPLSAH